MKGARVSPTGPLHSHDLEVRRTCWGGMCCSGRGRCLTSDFPLGPGILLKIFCVFRNLMKMSVFPRTDGDETSYKQVSVEGPCTSSTQLSPDYYMWEKKQDGNLSGSKLWGQRGEGSNVGRFKSTVSKTLPFTKVQGGEIVKDSSKVESMPVDGMLVRVGKEPLWMELWYQRRAPASGGPAHWPLLLCEPVSSITSLPLDLICVVCQTLLNPHS